MSTALPPVPAPAKSELRQVLGSFPTGVTVVTTRTADGVPCGFTANSFVSVSLAPPLVAVCLGRQARLHPVFTAAPAFAINILAQSQQPLAHAFASPLADRFAGVAWQAGDTASPLLDGSAAWLECTVHSLIEAGDHTVLIGLVTRCARSGEAPLAFQSGRYAGVVPIDPAPVDALTA